MTTLPFIVVEFVADMKCHVSLPDVPLTPAENFRDNIPVPCASVVPSVDEDLPGIVHR